MNTYTLEDLAHYDGKEGRPAYVAYQGKVYDVTRSFLWKDGRHQALHEAGRDLTEDLAKAPHGAGLLIRVPVIGVLADKSI